MNRLDPPDYFDDAAALDALALNQRLKCYPQLAAQAPAIKAGYVQYVAVNGDAHSVANVVLPDPIKAQLKALYASPSKELPHIDRIREESDANCCPMCGSFHSGTLDHLLPKTDYPVFAIFGRNLVPACKCNSKRTDQLTGAPNERILHPYFDDVLRERLFVARFEDPPPSRTIGMVWRKTSSLAGRLMQLSEAVRRSAEALRGQGHDDAAASKPRAARPTPASMRSTPAGEPRA